MTAAAFHGARTQRTKTRGANKPRTLSYRARPEPTGCLTSRSRNHEDMSGAQPAPASASESSVRWQRFPPGGLVIAPEEEPEGRAVQGSLRGYIALPADGT